MLYTPVADLMLDHGKLAWLIKLQPLSNQDDYLLKNLSPSKKPHSKQEALRVTSKTKQTEKQKPLEDALM